MVLAHQAHVAHRQVAESPVYELGGRLRRAGPEVGAIHERHLETGLGGLERDAAADDPGSNDEQVDFLIEVAHHGESSQLVDPLLRERARQRGVEDESCSLAAGGSGRFAWPARAVTIVLRRMTICWGRATRQAAVPIRIIWPAGP